MARIYTTVYKNSLTASLVSLLGTCLLIFGGFGIIGGITMIFDGDPFGQVLLSLLVGFAVAALGVGVQYLAYKIAQAQNNSRWLKEIKRRGLAPQIAASTEIALQIYLANPSQWAKEYIIALNPAAKERIEGYENSRRK